MILPSSPLLRRLPVAAGALLVGLLAASPAQAASDRAERMRSDRPAAERALRQAAELARGAGVSRGRELTPALATVYGRSAALAPADREAAGQLLARPTDNSPGQPGGPYTAPSTAAWTDHYCFHWVESGVDAPPGSDGNLNTIPPYLQDVADVFETVYEREHGDLGWIEPISDGALGGCTDDGWEGRTDVYLKDLGKLGLYGYAAPDAGQDDTQHPYAFLVMDDDYAEYGYDDPMDPLEVTAAHEYNHVLQYAYDVLQDKWMFESTATWMEEKVFPDVDDYHQYVGPWAQLSTMPITRFDRQNGDKVYGSAVFNRWLDDDTTSRSSGARGSCRSTRTRSPPAPTTRRSARPTAPASRTSSRTSPAPRPSGRPRARASTRAPRSPTSSASRASRSRPTARRSAGSSTTPPTPCSTWPRRAPRSCS